MKQLKYNVALSLALFAFVACKSDNAKYTISPNKAYIAETETRGNSAGLLQVAKDEPEGRTAALHVRLSDKQTRDTEFRLRLMTEQELEAYNRGNETSFYLLPKEFYELGDSRVVVKAGRVMSDDLSIKVFPLSDEIQKSGNSYVLPFKLENVDGLSPIVGGDEYLYKINPTIITSAPVIGTDLTDGLNPRATKSYTHLRMLRATGGARVEMTKWTFECRINMSGFSKNNQMIFSHNGPRESEIYIRFGDAPIPNNKLNIKVFDKAQIDASNMSFEPDTWYHIAVVYDGLNVTLYVDGEKDIALDKVPGEPLILGDGLSIGNKGAGNQHFVNRAMISEVRFWSVARTPAELKEYQYSVSPKSKGLVHYWKMDEGQGRELKNSVEGGPSMFVVRPDGEDKNVPANIRWIEGVRSDKKTITKIPEGNAPTA